MPIAIQPSQALEALNEALQKRDDELDSLRKQLEQVRTRWLRARRPLTTETVTARTQAHLCRTGSPPDTA